VIEYPAGGWVTAASYLRISGPLMAPIAAKATLGLKNRPSLQGTFLPVNSAMKDNLKRDK
jgi:hypothetical protein